MHNDDKNMNNVFLSAAIVIRNESLLCFFIDKSHFDFVSRARSVILENTLRSSNFGPLCDCGLGIK